MKKLVFIAFFIFFIFSSISSADISNTINYQGRLMNSSSQPVTDGQYNITLRLYTALSGGTMEWEESQQVLVSNGYFNTVLGNATALTPSIFKQPLWISTQIGSDLELSPRQKLGTAAYAMNVVDGAITSEKIRDNSILSTDIGNGEVKAKNVSPEIHQRWLNPVGTSFDYITVTSTGNTNIAGFSIPIQTDYPATLNITFFGMVRNLSGGAAIAISDNSQAITHAYTEEQSDWGVVSLDFAYDIEAGASHDFTVKLKAFDGGTANLARGVFKIICFYRAKGQRTIYVHHQ